jgi:hypothetical protein
MEFRKAIVCSRCQQPMTSGEASAFVCFKIPGKEGYHFFHCRFRGGDCWDAYMKGEPTKVRTTKRPVCFENWI